jgi:hypothetical protein
VVTNDDFINAIALGSAAVVTGSVELSALFGSETGEPDAGTELDPAKTAWWTWEAPSTGIVRVDTLGSTFDTVLHVYTGSNASALTLIQANHDAGPQGRSILFFEARAGQIYHLRVRGESSLDVGQVELQVQIQAPAAASVDPASGGPFFSLTFERYIVSTGIVYTVAVSDDLMSWDRTQIQVEQVGLPVPVFGGVMEQVTYRLKQAMLPVGRKFLRLEIDVASP